IRVGVQLRGWLWKNLAAYVPGKRHARSAARQNHNLRDFRLDLLACLHHQRFKSHLPAAWELFERAFQNSVHVQVLYILPALVENPAEGCRLRLGPLKWLPGEIMLLRFSAKIAEIDLSLSCVSHRSCNCSGWGCRSSTTSKIA